MKLVYVSNNNWPGKEPGLTFSVFNARGFWQAKADCLLVLYGRTRRKTSEVCKELFGFENEFPIMPIRGPRIGGSKLPFYLIVFLTLLKSDRTILITRNLNFLPWAATLKKLKNMRIYFESHDFWTDTTIRDEKLTPGKRRAARLERKWVPHVDGIICVSEPQAQLYRQYYPDHAVLTALPGIKPSPVHRRKGFSYTLGYIGSFTQGKYPLNIVMEGLSRINHPCIRLICAGAKNEEEMEYMLGETKRLGIADRVEVYGWVTGEELEQLKARIDVGVAVLSNTFLNRIASPLKVFEYLSSATPFIATSLEGTRVIVKDGEQGLLTENTPDAWEHAIRTIYTDFPNYQHMANKCLSLASTLGWEQRAQVIIDAMNSGIFAAA
jgi:glycosyltransferase involved in cell wall biosynthesis